MQGSRARKRACWDLTGRPVWMEGSRGPDHGGPCRQWSGSEFTPATVGRLWRAPEALELDSRVASFTGSGWQNPAGLLGALPKWGPRAPATCSPGRRVLPHQEGLPPAWASVTAPSPLQVAPHPVPVKVIHAQKRKSITHNLTAYGKPQLMFGIFLSDFFPTHFFFPYGLLKLGFLFILVCNSCCLIYC